MCSGGVAGALTRRCSCPLLAPLTAVPTADVEGFESEQPVAEVLRHNARETQTHEWQRLAATPRPGQVHLLGRRGLFVPESLVPPLNGAHPRGAP